MSIPQFEKLSPQEIETLLKAPALISVLTASVSHEIDKLEKAGAIKLAHLKTFTANPLLLPYYAEVEKSFKADFEAAVKKYAPFDDAERAQLKEEIEEVNAIIGKLDKEFATALHQSLTGYAEHVKKSGRGTFINFVFPMPIKGLTD